MKHERQDDDSEPLAKKVRTNDEEDEEAELQVFEELLVEGVLDEEELGTEELGVEFSMELGAAEELPAAPEGLSFLNVVKELFSKFEDPIACSPVTVRMDAFLDDLRSEIWPTHDIAMDKDWDDIVVAFIDAGTVDLLLPFLVKPSGPKRAALCILWHYATYTTKKREYGMTLDPSNPCLALQWRKIADNTKVRTQDTYPMRADYNPKGPQWDGILGDKTAAILEICHRFAKAAVLAAPFSIIMGESNAKLVRKTVEEDDELTAETVSLRIPTALFGEDPCLIFRSKESGRILHIFVFSYHGMWFLKVKKPAKELLVLHDLIWNAVCQWSGVPIAKEDLFSDRKDAEHLGIFQTVVMLRKKEISSGINIDREQALGILSNVLSQPKNAELVETLAALDEKSSLLLSTIRYWGKKAVATRSNPEWQQSEAAVRQREGRIATMSTLEWQQSEAAVRQREGREKGVATRSNPEWQQSEAGARQREGGKKGVLIRLAEFQRKWDAFYNDPEVQKVVNPEDEDKLTPRDRALGARIQAANVKAANEDNTRRSDIIKQYAVFKGNEMRVLPGLAYVRKKRKEILAEM